MHSSLGDVTKSSLLFSRKSKTARLAWLVASGLVIVLNGCKKQPPANSAWEKVGLAEADQASDNAATFEQEPSIVFTHPIDQLPEGKRFRMAARAIDAGDNKTAESIRDELRSGHFGPLATAIDAIMLVKQGKYDAAIQLAEEISQIPVMQAESYVIAGEVFQRQNRWSEAINAFSNALALNPQHVRARLWLGAIYYDIGAMGKANDELRAAAALDPQEINALLLSGKIFQDYEQYQEAIKDYQTVLQRETSEDKALPVRIRMAQCMVELRKFPEAAQVLSNCPSIPEVVAIRAAIAEADGQFEAAARLAQEAIDKQPHNRTAGMILGRILVTEKKWEAARAILQGLVDGNPYDHEPRLLFGRALVGSGEVERGQAEIQAAADLKDTFLKFAALHQEAMRQPENADLRNELGRLAEKLGKQELAESWYQSAKALKTGSENAPVNAFESPGGGKL